ncbi:MAG TPA: hypothetical protein RMH80_13055, partial [Polyangiaceae bacterium LLY-WYZ-15_(1-7)]|nr:hypothetical protein [Polyangiaceae bacterium LLY-WYZ-15_(1-7)]
GAIRLEPSGPAASPDGPLLGGAVVDPASGWSEAGFPAPYTRAVSDVAESRGRRLALFPDRQEVRAFDEMEPELGAPVLAGAPFTALEGHDTLIAAAAGGQLYLVDPAALPRRRFESPPVASVVPVEDGADVLGLALLGRDVFVTTTTGALYRIRVGALPIVDTRDVRVERVATGLGVARHLAVDGEHAFVAREAELQRVALASGAVEELTLDAPIRGVALDAGSLWAAADRSLWRIDAQAPTWAGAERVRELAHTITALAADQGRVVTGHGPWGLQVHAGSRARRVPSSALATPRAGAIVRGAEALRFELADPAGLRALRLELGGRVVASSSQPPFALDAPLPEGLVNGRTYDLVAVAEAVDGTVWSSPARSLVVDGDESPTNPGLTVALTASASGTWIPGTTELRAQVQGSAHPVARVELYRCDAPSGGDCALVASTPGPEFVFWRADAAGVHHYFARVVDVHGNGADSTRVELERVVDGEAPSIGGLRLEGPLKDGQPIEGQPYEVVVEGLADAQSGFDVATLERNGAIVAVTVVGGELRYSEPAPTLAESLTYRVVARDRAGLERTLSASFTVREDAPPTALLEGVAGGVDEGRAQRVFATLADDVAMASARYRWQGAWRPLPLGPRGPDGTHRPSFEITYEGERLTAPVDVPLELEATDIAGHTTAASVPVRVRPLTAPQPDQFHVSAPDRIYLGTSATVSVELRNGGRPVTLSLIDVSAEPIEVARRDGATTLAHTFRVPDDYAHDALRFFARAVDALGQTGQSAVVEVPIVRHPNTVAFVTGAGATPAAAGAGDPVSLTVEVRDAAARPVAGQPVRFLWRDAGLERFVGLAPTDGEGRGLTFPPVHMHHAHVRTARCDGHERGGCEAAPVGLTFES